MSVIKRVPKPTSDAQPARRKRQRAGRSKLGRSRKADVATYAVFGVFLLFFGIPLVWVLSLSFRPQAEVFDVSLNVIPKNPTLENYKIVLQSANFPTFLLNSVKLAVGGSVGAIMIAAPAAYAFSRFKFRGSSFAMIAILALQMISPLVIMIPLYRFFARLDLLDSHLSGVFVYMAILVPIATWMLKGFFDAIPTVLDEAAMVDGASRFQVFRLIILPLIAPGLTSVFVITTILAWGEFTIPYILFADPDLLPISVGILNFKGNYAATSTQILAAGAVLAILPAILVFILMQRFIVRALTAGAVKG